MNGFLNEKNFDLTNEVEIKYQFGDYTGGEKVSDDERKEIKKRRADELDIIFYGEYIREEADELVDRHGKQYWQRSK